MTRVEDDFRVSTILPKKQIWLPQIGCFLKSGFCEMSFWGKKKSLNLDLFDFDDFHDPCWFHINQFNQKNHGSDFFLQNRKALIFPKQPIDGILAGNLLFQQK